MIIGNTINRITVDIVDNTQLGNTGLIHITGHGIPGKTPPGAAPQELRVVSSQGSFVQVAVTISSAACSGTTATIATSVPHQIQKGQKVFVSGVSETGYNGVFTVTGVESNTFEYTVTATLGNGSGGAVYLPTLISSQVIIAATLSNNTVTVTLSGTANIPLNSPIFISGLTGAGQAWNGVQTVSQNSSSDPALKSSQFQFKFEGANGTPTVPENSTVHIVALSPEALTSLPSDPATHRPYVTLDSNIEGYSAQLVVMVTPTNQAPFPLSITPGTANLSNLGIPPFAPGQQAGTSVADIIEFYYASAQNSTFDVSQVDGFALPLTLKCSEVTSGPSQVGLNPALPGLSRQAIGQAFKIFIEKEPPDVRKSRFDRLFYDQSVEVNTLTVAPASQAGTPLKEVHLAPATNNPPSVLVKATTPTPHGLVPGQKIQVTGAGSPYDGKFSVTATGLTDDKMTNTEFTYTASQIPGKASTGTVTPTNSGAIATGLVNLVVEVTSGTVPSQGASVRLRGVQNDTFDAPYTVLSIPPVAGLPATAVYLATTTGQTFKVGDSSGGGTLSTLVLVQPPSVPGGQFYVITAPKDWLANQSVTMANNDPMVTWWDSTINTFFAAGNYLQVAISPTTSYTGVYNSATQAFDFYKGVTTSGTSSFHIPKPKPKPAPSGGQSQSLANATWVWGQANIPSNDKGTVWDQIVQAFCRGVAMDGVLTSAPTSAGQSNAAWTNTTNWYTEHASPNFPQFTSVYCPFSKFLHYGTLSGGTDRTGSSSIYLQTLAYGFSEDETPVGSDGKVIATGVPSKMDGTVPDGAKITLTVNLWG